MKSLVCGVCFLVGPCTWEPGQGVPGCRGGLRPFCCVCSCLVFKRLPQEWSYLSFHLFTCTMGFAPIKWTCTALFRPRQLTDRAILANRQPQEKKRAVPFFAAVLFVFVFQETSVGMVLSDCFTFSPAQWAPPQLNGHVQLLSLFSG